MVPRLDVWQDAARDEPTYRPVSRRRVRFWGQAKHSAHPVGHGLSAHCRAGKNQRRGSIRARARWVFLSNGPGDPEPCDYAIAAIGEFLAKGLPVFGICLGHQLLALAAGAKTEKMKFGHHGANHPVQDLASGQVMITSQNHGFAVDETTLPDNVETTHRSLFDGTLQGIAFTDRPALSFQGHPEASPGPHDMSPLFERFIQFMDAQKKTGLKAMLST